MRTITLHLGFVLLIGFCCMANAESRTDSRKNFHSDLSGSWTCGDNGLITFNREGTISADDSSNFTSTYHGVWKRTGRNTFDATVYTIIYSENDAGTIDKTDASVTMTDNNNINVIILSSESGTADCTRITLP